MYDKIYETLNRQGIVKTAVLLDGPHMGERCILQEKRPGIQEARRADSAAQAQRETGGRELFPEEIGAAAATGVYDIGGRKIFVEIYQKNPHLIILGGGHVSCPVAKIGKMLGFHVTVMDDREEFVTGERFPEADCLIAGSFAELEKKIPPYSNAYYAVVTRGHAGDCVCAEQILKRPYEYFGMIGSKTKVKLTREKLLEEGFCTEELDTIHAPIGLPIGGQLPEEIAVSIMAEIVQVKNLRSHSYSDESVEKAVISGKKGVMLTIIGKSGSSPRGVGSKMYLCEDGEICGSIGGGTVEYRAMCHGRSVRETDIQRYDLSAEDSGKLGMICGGRVEILFERI